MSDLDTDKLAGIDLADLHGLLNWHAIDVNARKRLRLMAPDLAAEVLRLRVERDAAVDKYEATDGMDGAITCAIREMLNTQDVPKAAFIDDHVGNALIQRLQYRAEVLRLTAANAALTVRVEEAYRLMDRGLWLTDDATAVRAWLAGKDGA